MKSDREFIQGIYEKADEMRLSTQTEMDKELPYKKQWNSIFILRPVYFRFAMLTAAFVLLITSGVFLKSFTFKDEIEKPQTFGVIPRGMPAAEDEQLIWDKVTDVIEVRTSKNDSSFEIVKVYQGQAREEKLLNQVQSNISHLDNGQTALVLMQINDADTMVLDVYYSDKDHSTYSNLSNEVLTKESLMEHLNDK